MKAARFLAQHAKLQVSTVPIPEPKEGEVRVKIICCGICHGDIICQHGGMGNQWPKTPGHEAVGHVDALGQGVTNFKVGDYVGIGWSFGTCGNCDACLFGNALKCPSYAAFGTHVDGGYAEYAIAKKNGVVRIPKELKPEEAAPLLCAGVTTFISLLESGARPGDLVVIQGIGGLGHLAVQYARKMGFHTIAVSRGTGKAEFSKKLGAHAYFDSESPDLVKNIQSLGGAKLILSTVTEKKAVEQILPALGNEGKLVLVGAVHEPLSVNTLPMLMGKQSLAAWRANGSKDVLETLKFSVLQDIKPIVEEFPLDKADEAYEHAMQQKAKFRAVVRISQ